MEKQKWKFFYNGYTWWLRIETVEQLMQYCELTDEGRFGGAMMTVAHHRMGDIKGHYDGKYDGIAGDLDALNSILKEDLLTTTGRLRLACHETYLKNFMSKGFVNINRLGGCNCCDWEMKIVVQKDELIFPVYSRKDVKIKTWEMTEAKYGAYRPNYNYHWYAYVGDVRLRDGDKEKWDTRAECEAFVNTLFMDEKT
jgi:hypothetical protein